jgi:hypothetical protein
LLNITTWLLERILARVIALALPYLSVVRFFARRAKKRTTDK